MFWLVGMTEIMIVLHKRTHRLAIRQTILDNSLHGHPFNSYRSELTELSEIYLGFLFVQVKFRTSIEVDYIKQQNPCRQLVVNINNIN